MAITATVAPRAPRVCGTPALVRAAALEARAHDTSNAIGEPAPSQVEQGKLASREGGASFGRRSSDRANEGARRSVGDRIHTTHEVVIHAPKERKEDGTLAGGRQARHVKRQEVEDPAQEV